MALETIHTHFLYCKHGFRSGWCKAPGAWRNPHALSHYHTQGDCSGCPAKPLGLLKNGGGREYHIYGCFSSVIQAALQLFHVAWPVFCLKQKHFLLSTKMLMGYGVCISDHNISKVALNMLLWNLDKGSIKVARTSLLSLTTWLCLENVPTMTSSNDDTITHGSFGAPSLSPQFLNA